MAAATDIAASLDRLLRTREVPDYSGAMNGLQLATRREVRRVAAAVDFSRVAVDEIVRAEGQLLIVHHGMFWGEPQPITGVRYDMIAALIEHGIAVYSSHLPLDLHPELGNNVLLARSLGLEPTAGFARFKDVEIGVSGESDVPTAELLERVRGFARVWGGNAVASAFAPGRRTRRWAACTGAGADADTIRDAVARRIDTMIVGEGPHHTAVQARDLGIVIVYAGHYATETLGVRALAQHVAAEFELEWIFVDAPTGL